jgi:hypothetical protein
MRRLVGLLTVLLLFDLAGPAQAFPPSPVTTIIPCGIVLVGVNHLGEPDPAGWFTIIPKDIAGNPECDEGPVVMDFSGCPEITICAVRVEPGVEVSCDASTRRLTLTAPESNCEVKVALVGSVTNRAVGSGAGIKISVGAVMITDGINHPLVTVSALDESGGDGLSPSDLGRWFSDSFSPTYEPRSDFDHNATCVNKVGPTDLALWLKSYFDGYVFGCESVGGTMCP